MQVFGLEVVGGDGKRLQGEAGRGLIVHLFSDGFKVGVCIVYFLLALGGQYRRWLIGYHHKRSLRQIQLLLCIGNRFLFFGIQRCFLMPEQMSVDEPVRRHVDDHSPVHPLTFQLRGDGGDAVLVIGGRGQVLNLEHGGVEMRVVSWWAGARRVVAGAVVGIG